MIAEYCTPTGFFVESKKDRLTVGPYPTSDEAVAAFARAYIGLYVERSFKGTCQRNGCSAVATEYHALGMSTVYVCAEHAREMDVQP